MRLLEFFVMSEGEYAVFEPEANGDGVLIRCKADGESETGTSTEMVARGDIDALIRAYNEDAVEPLDDESQDEVRRAWEQAVTDGEAVRLEQGVGPPAIEMVERTQVPEDEEGFDPDELQGIEGFES